MMRLNADGIDESQWLPEKVYNEKTEQWDKVPIVNAFREMKGDIVQLDEDGGVHKVINWLPDALKSNGYIEKEHHDTCKTFERILIQAKRTLSICQLKGPLFEKPPEEIKNDADMYILIKNKLIRREMIIMIWLVEETKTDGNMRAANDLIGKIHHAIENSQRIIDSVKKNDNIRKSASPEV